jgi:hypothetical protein
MTWGQLADALAPLTTDTMVAPYRDPSRADQPAVIGSAVTPGAVTLTSVQGTFAYVAARGDRSDGGTVWRTVGLVHGDDGAWKVNAVR